MVQPTPVTDQHLLFAIGQGDYSFKVGRQGLALLQTLQRGTDVLGGRSDCPAARPVFASLRLSSSRLRVFLNRIPNHTVSTHFPTGFTTILAVAPESLITSRFQGQGKCLVLSCVSYFVSSKGMKIRGYGFVPDIAK